MAKEAVSLVWLAQDRSLGGRVFSVAGGPGRLWWMPVAAGPGAASGCGFPALQALKPRGGLSDPWSQLTGKRKGGEAEGPELEADYPTAVETSAEEYSPHAGANAATHGANEGSSAERRSEGPLVRNTRRGPRDSRPPPT